MPDTVEVAPPAPSNGLPAGVAQILDTGGVVVGAGFLVAEDVVVTCAHVVTAAGTGPGGTLRLAFPHAPGTPRPQGRVLSEPWRDPAAEDVAVIRLTEGPTGVTPLPLGSAEGRRGHRVRSFGFPAQAPSGGHHGYGSVGDLLPAGTGDGVGGGLLLQLADANDLTTGFSGAPVVDEPTGRVIGMLTSITAPDSHLKGLGIAYATPTQVLRDAWPYLAVEDDVCPYRELEPFTSEHAAWFHGRGAAVERVLGALAGQRRAVLLLGPSGAGKSSLAQAGLLPALAEGRLPGSDRWLPVVVRPDQDLLAEIERAGLPGAADDGIIEAAQRRLAAEPGHERVLLVIDQLEELLTHTMADDSLGDRCLAALRQITAAIASPGALSVLLVMRDDFYSRLAALAPELLEAAEPGLVNMPATLDTHDLRAMITLPARSVGLRFEEGLADRIVADVLAGGPDGSEALRAPITVLPLLELTLSQLWRRRVDGYLTHDGYQAIGRVTGSLTAWCDDAVRTLPAELRPTAQRILTTLVRPADEAHDIPAVRQQVPVATLRELAVDTIAAASSDQQLKRADEVLAALTRHRIVTTRAVRVPGHGADDPGRPVAELIHDALIREWGTLRAWVAKDRQFQEWLRRTREQHELWTRSERQGDLLDGTDLAEGVSWSAQRGLPADIAVFLGVSRAAEARRRRVRRIGVALLTVLALIASGAAVVALVERSNADAQRRSALARTLAAESQSMLKAQPGLAKQLAIASYRLDHGVGTAAMLTALSGPGVFDSPDPVVDLAETHDGHTLLMSTGTAIAVWSTSHGRISRITGVTAGPLAVSPDGRVLAAGTSGGRNGSVRLWSLADPAHPAPLGSLPAGVGRITAVAISADGRLLAAGAPDGAIRLWDISAPAGARQLPSLTGHRGGVDSLAFSPSHRLLASSGGDQRVRLWNLADPSHASSPVATLDSSNAEADTQSTYLPVVHRIAFTPDGTTLAGPGDGNNIAIRLWGVGVPSRPRLLAAAGADAEGTGPTGTQCGKNLRSIAFNGSGHVFAAVCNATGDGSLTLWQAHDMAHVVPVYTLPGVDTQHNGPVLFEPRSSVLLHATGSGVQQWDAGNPYQPGADGSYGQVPDGFEADAVISGGRRRLLAVVGGDSGQLIDLTGRDGHHVVRDLPGGYIGASAVAFTPDGGVLADSEHVDVGHDARKLVLRLRNTRESNVPVLATVDSIDEGVHSIAFSSDGRIMAVADNNDDRNNHYTAGPSVKLFDVKDPAHPRQIARLPADAFHVALSPDGRLLTANTADSLLSWNVSDPRHPLPRPVQRLTPGSVTSASAFRPDGQWIAVGDSSGTIRLWKVDRDQISGPPSIIRSPSYPGSAPSFSPDGRTIAFPDNGDTGNSIGPEDQRGHVALWDVSDPHTPVPQGGVAYQSSNTFTGSVAFSPTGHFLVATISRSIDVWSTVPEDNMVTLCTAVGDVITPEEWGRYVPNEPYTPPCEHPNVPETIVPVPTGTTGAETPIGGL
ncbi:trypsin-like peptidase domain-containing protein [Streptomyces hygroscopicus]|uniref:nSTAND1 domain-containing NTPase n=1 Tax=Streptomyces hygroscopicus TaxID=1912 RepID=UPI00223E914A|nr:trypsin-like peptidase domain-containing protein [Streptomyces hygroscopicus]